MNGLTLFTTLLETFTDPVLFREVTSSSSALPTVLVASNLKETIGLLKDKVKVVIVGSEERQEAIVVRSSIHECAEQVGMDRAVIERSWTIEQGLRVEGRKIKG